MLFFFFVFLFFFLPQKQDISESVIFVICSSGCLLLYTHSTYMTYIHTELKIKCSANIIQQIKNQKQLVKVRNHSSTFSHIYIGSAIYPFFGKCFKKKNYWIFSQISYFIWKENNFIQMAVSAGHAIVYAISPIFKHMIDCMQLYFTNDFTNNVL